MQRSGSHFLNNLNDGHERSNDPQYPDFFCRQLIFPVVKGHKAVKQALYQIKRLCLDGFDCFTGVIWSLIGVNSNGHADYIMNYSHDMLEKGKFHAFGIMNKALFFGDNFEFRKAYMMIRNKEQNSKDILEDVGDVFEDNGEMFRISDELPGLFFYPHQVL